MLNPRVVGVTGGGRTKLPTHIVLQLFLSPVGEVERRICHNKICFERRVEVIKESVCLIRPEVGVDTTDRHIHLCHLPSIGVALLTINRDFTTIAAVRLYKLCTLNEHTAGATARVIDTAVGKRFQNSDNGFNNAGWGIEFAALYTFIRCKLSNTVFISSAEEIFTVLVIAHIHIGEQVNHIAQNTFVQIWACIVFGQHIFQTFVFCFNSPHCIVDKCANFRGVSSRSNLAPPCILRYEENVIFGVGITVIFEAVALSDKLLITLFKRIGYVAQENKSYDHFSVFCCGDMSPKDTGSVPDLFFKADCGVVSVSHINMSLSSCYISLSFR